MKLENLLGISKTLSIVFEDPLMESMERFEIETPKQKAAFLSNSLIESAYFQRLEENLNYSEKRLIEVFPKLFTPKKAKAYAYKPVSIANYVYANKGGNGRESSGDGWRFRGRGLFQTTLRNNYEDLSIGTGIDYVANPDLLVQPSHACISAGYYFKRHGLNELAEADKIDELIIRINRAGLLMNTRKNLYFQILERL